MASESLSWRSFIDREWYSPDEVERLVNVTELDLVEDFPPERLRRHLNEIINVSVACQLERTRSKQEWLQLEKLVASVLEYVDLSVDWGDFGLPLPRLSADQVNLFKGLKAELESLPHDKIRRRVGAWEDVLFPRALGLYAAAFGEEPMSTLTEPVEKVPHQPDFSNPAINFLEEILLFIRNEQVRLVFEARCGRPDLPDLVWKKYESRTISNSISKSKRAKSTAQSQHLLWEEFRHFYSNH